jgi:transposase
VHLDFCEIAICEDGKVRSAGRVKSTLEALKVLAESLLATDRVALEVTGSAWEILRILEPHVAKVIVVSPGDTGITQARAKTDRLDSRTLARLLWAGELDSVWTPDELTRVLRRRLARREQLVRSRSRSKNEVHAVLMRRLVGRAPVSDLFGVKGRQWLRQLELAVEEAETVKGWSWRSRRQRRSRGACATSSFSTRRSPRSKDWSPDRCCRALTPGG